MESDFIIISDNESDTSIDDCIDDCIYQEPIQDTTYDVCTTPPIIQTPNNISLLYFFTFYKLSTINWALLQSPVFVSRHI